MNAEQKKYRTSLDAPWWKGAAIYHIYPRSFMDSNNDGTGDLQGIISKLDYIASLAVDAIWLSPIFKSPQKDFGYDVSDYRDIDPLFGTLEDFDKLLSESHKRGLKVIVDQVYSHTSDQHPWFEESSASRDNPKSDWYVWADPKPCGSPPTNWQSVFGGPSWQWSSRRRQYYLHNFLTEQPDLNLHTPEVQDEILDIARFWLNRGVDGFRMDALNFSMHDLEMRDNPAETEFEREPTRPFDYQRQEYNQSHPDIPRFLEKVRQLFDQYPGSFTVAEVGGKKALEEMKDYTAEDKRLHSAYSFDYLYAENLTAERVKQSIENWPQNPQTGWPSWAYSNHDAPRALSRWKGDCPADEFNRLMLLTLIAMRGNIFLYQGEELGMLQGHVPYEKLQDPEAIANYPETLGRDGARTPIPWCSRSINAGFNKGTEPWLPIDPRHFETSVDKLEADKTSALHFTRALLKCRKDSEALRLGQMNFLKAEDDLLLFTRQYQDELILCGFNLGCKTLDLASIVDTKPCEMLAAANLDQTLTSVPNTLKGHSGFIVRYL
ncbi:alpha glucosidase [Temperatibacter marinus]|uniref:Alpha glucosidase n=1 Tax=Temperatibacter marinus TaxID=1456591 RepID=A0AA52EHZ2_9PROT|nr:alpha glucosidase [Temperatibacter marinus]WND02854.1 alpha glucosidase [Temperatibacter marinus]